MARSKILKKKIPFGKPIIDKKEINLVNSVLKNNILVHGPKSIEFENKFASFTKSKYAISVSSCTAGMHLIYFSLGIGKNDEVLVPAQTHVATAHAVELAGAKAVFVDCELETGNIDINKIEKKITSKTKAITIVHYAGIPVNMRKILKIAKKFKLLVIEDCALAIGSKISGKHVGLHGDFGVFSFYPVKQMTTGEGGMIISKNSKYIKKLRLKKAFGVNKIFSDRKTPGLYDCLDLGFNYRMSEIHCAIGIQQLNKIKKFLFLRKRNFSIMKKNLENLRLIKILNSNNKKLVNSNYCMTIILNKKISNKRTKIIKYLNSKGIGTSIYYPQPVPRMTYYKEKYNYKPNDYKNAEIISDNSIALPVGPHISTKEIIYICEQFKKSLITL